MSQPMQQQQPKYKFYPSLLDQFEKYLHIDREFEHFFNRDRETEEYKKTYEEIEAEKLLSLLNSINRVPFDSEKADKGTAFNDIVDYFIHGKQPIKTQIVEDINADQITATCNNRTFYFSYRFCCKAAEYFHGSISQLFVRAILPTKYGNVELYGYIDELIRNKVYDIKTTSRYEFGKYSEGWQRHVYPYCLLASGLVKDIDSFEYTAYQLKGGTSRTPLITGVQYPELYKYDPEQSKGLLTLHCERFIEFLESNRELITDKKVFGGENDDKSKVPLQKISD